MPRALGLARGGDAFLSRVLVFVTEKDLLAAGGQTKDGLIWVEKTSVGVRVSHEEVIQDREVDFVEMGRGPEGGGRRENWKEKGSNMIKM